MRSDERRAAAQQGVEAVAGQEVAIARTRTIIEVGADFRRRSVATNCRKTVTTDCR